jgi:hypothetical protein
MTAPETFTVSSKRPLTTGRRPDRTGVGAKAAVPLGARAFTARSGNSGPAARSIQTAFAERVAGAGRPGSNRLRAVALSEVRVQIADAG